MNAFGSTMAVAPRIDDSQTVTATGQRALRLRFGLLPLERLAILAGNYRDQFVPRFVPLRQRPLGARAARVFRVLLDEAAHSVLLAEIHKRDQIDHRQLHWPLNWSNSSRTNAMPPL